MARLMALCSLPRTNPEKQKEYKRVNGPYTLYMIAGGGNKLPFGNLPRLLLAWVCTEAVRTQSRELILGRSLSKFMRTLGAYNSGGQPQTRLRNQMKRLFGCTVSLIYKDECGEQFVSSLIAERGEFWWNERKPDEPSLWNSKIELGENFFHEIIRHPARERNNKRREAGERVVDGRGHSGGRFRRERMSPQREPREAIPAEREGPERERVAWQRAEERTQWERIQRWREKDLGKLERRSKREWSALYGRQERQREQLAKDCHGVLGRFRVELEDRLRWERISLGKAHSEAVREIESLAGGVYRSGMEGAEGRAREATRRDGLAVYDRYRGEDWDRLKRSASEESGWSRCGRSTESKLTRR